MITAGVGMKVFDPLRIRGAQTGDVERGAAAQTDYFNWARAVQKAKLDHAMCMDIIGMGLSLRNVDQNRRQPRGTAKKNLVLCLDLFNDLRK
jgi:hypothetical protein